MAVTRRSIPSVHLNVTTPSGGAIDTLAHHSSKISKCHSYSLYLSRYPQAEFFVQSKAAIDLADLQSENVAQK